MCEPLWFLAPGLVLPEAAVLAVLAIERAGHTLVLDGDDLLVERGRGAPPLDPADLDALRRWKYHAWLFVRLCATDVGTTAHAPQGTEGSTHV